MRNKFVQATGTLLCVLLVVYLLPRNECPAQTVFVSKETAGDKPIEIQNPIPSRQLLEQMPMIELELLFHRYVVSPQTSCSMVERMGKITDGGWELCLDPRYAPDPKNCLVYSFGINNDFSYDDAMENFGCEVHSFDPSMNTTKDHVRGQKVHFHLAGIGPGDEVSSRNWKIYTLRTLRQKLGHKVGQRRIDVLKLDVESAEVDLFPVAFKDGSLSDVPQIAFELHCAGYKAQKCMVVLREAYDHGLRIYMTNRNTYCRFTSQKTGYTRTSCHEVYMVNITLAKQYLVAQQS